MSAAGADRQKVAELVGREQELRLLRAAMETAPALVLVVGEAGVGKSRLVAELARDADLGELRRSGREHPVRWLTGRCYPVHDPGAWTPVAEAVRGIDGLDSFLVHETGPIAARYSSWSGLA